MVNRVISYNPLPVIPKGKLAILESELKQVAVGNHLLYPLCCHGNMSMYGLLVLSTYVHMMKQNLPIINQKESLVIITGTDHIAKMQL